MSAVSQPVEQRSLDRRSSHRRDAEGAIRVEGSDNEYVEDISLSGVFIRTDNPQPVGTRMQLRLTVILDELRTVEGEAEVVRVVFPGGLGPAGMGVKFHSLSAESNEFIERLVSSP